MKHPRPSRICLALLVACAARSAALAQCPVLELPRGYGALSGGHAIQGIAGAPPRVDFYTKTATGWQADGSAIVGDATYVWPVVVAMDEDRAVAGASEASDIDYLQGRAFVFERSGTQWSSTELVSGTIEDSGFFGASVAVRGDVAAVGELRPYAWPQRTHVFERVGGTWTETAIFPIYGELAIDGATLVVGVGDRAEVFRKAGGSWISTQTLTGRPGAFGGAFGYSVALREGRLAVAGQWWSGSTYLSYVRVFRDEAGMFVPVQTLVPDPQVQGNRFGTSLAVSGSTLLVGAPGNMPSYPYGAVHRFTDDGLQFVRDGIFTTDGLGIQLGERVDIDGEDAILSALWSTAIFRMGFEQAVAYCPTTPNSTGAHGALDVEGCDSRSGAQLTLVTSNLPPNVLARCIFGERTAQVPFGDGFRCVGTPSHRLPASMTDGAGNLATRVDFSAVGTHLQPGTTSHFQTFHRDRVGSGVNLTNALSIAITP